jgi:hypothetical protein
MPPTKFQIKRKRQLTSGRTRRFFGRFAAIHCKTAVSEEGRMQFHSRLLKDRYKSGTGKVGKLAASIGLKLGKAWPLVDSQGCEFERPTYGFI